MRTYKIGAVLYALWGIMHVAFGVQMYGLNASGTATAILDAFYLQPGPAPTPEALGSTVDAIMYQHAWNLFWFGAVSTVIAVFFNWKNSVAGYWANLILVSAADIGFVWTIMIPGYVSFSLGIWGPVLWIGGAVFATLGILGSSKS